MGTSKVVFSGDTLVDLTGDTVTADKMLNGIIAHNKSGDRIVGNIKVNKCVVTSIPVADSYGDENDINVVIPN